MTLPPMNDQNGDEPKYDASPEAGQFPPEELGRSVAFLAMGRAILWDRVAGGEA